MSDHIDNKKVINLFSKHDKSQKTGDSVRFYAGFNYVKIHKDVNGNRFSKDALLAYKDKCHYIVTVMREQEGETVLYSYNVPNNDLLKFMKSFDENKLDGTIIEINKYFPDDLA